MAPYHFQATILVTQGKICQVNPKIQNFQLLSPLHLGHTRFLNRVVKFWVSGVDTSTPRIFKWVKRFSRYSDDSGIKWHKSCQLWLFLLPAINCNDKNIQGPIQLPYLSHTIIYHAKYGWNRLQTHCSCPWFFPSTNPHVEYQTTLANAN